MTPYETDDPIFERLKQMPLLAPDLERSDRLRIRCRTQLGRSRRHRESGHAPAGFESRAVGTIVFATFCLLYVMGLVTTALRLHRLVP